MDSETCLTLAGLALGVLVFIVEVIWDLRH